jgi:flavodoxin
MNVEDISFLLREATRLVNGDPVQGAEKLYKVAEECIKQLAEIKLPKYRGYSANGKWRYGSLGEAANDLSQIYGDYVINGWDAAKELHVEGFHENRLTIEEVRSRVQKIVDLFELTKGELNIFESSTTPP